MFKAGSIRKVKVTNFVTYSYVEFYPGPHLNMIIGPNGTGKSTIVAAIILGLGGNPKVVGRGTKISEYVKHDCEASTIDIYLQTESENQYLKVTREFNIHEKSVWKLNNKKVRVDDVLEHIQIFNIQVNNLCQFLPQDRVQDFAKLNKQDLLIETQKALCRFDLIEKQEHLINNKGHHENLLGTIEKHTKRLHEAEDANARLEGRVQGFNKKKEYSKFIENIERKIAWTLYEDIRTQVTEVKTDRSKAQEVYDRYRNALKPKENEIDKLKTHLAELQQTNTKNYQFIKNTELSVNAYIGKADTLKDSLKKVVDDMNMKLTEITQWDKEIENVSIKLQEMEKLQTEMHHKISASVEERSTLAMETNKLTIHQKKLQNKIEEIQQAKQDDMIKIRDLENACSRLENVKQNRFQYLEKMDQDAAQAVQWLRNNKHLFEDMIFEPIMLELNVLDARQAKYVENSIPMRDRLAFTCIKKTDMNKLVRCLRESHNLSVNVVYSSTNGSGLKQFQPRIPIEQLRKFGFYTYVNNLFTAPEPIMQYLCKTYNLHNIPVGDQTTNAHYEQLPSQIRVCFSDNYKYIISYSKYSGQKSTRQSEVRTDQTLSLSLDVVRLDNLKGQIQEIQKNIQNCNIQSESVQGQLVKIEEKIESFRAKIREIQQEKDRAQTVNARIETTRNKIIEMQRNKKSPETIEAEAANKMKSIIQNMEPIQEQLKNDYKKFCKFSEKSALTSLQIESVRRKLAYRKNQIDEDKRKADEAAETLNLIKDQYTHIMTEAKALLTKAKSLSKGFTPVDEGFAEFRADYDQLPSDKEQLATQKEQYQSRIACLNTADDGEMREYEARLEQIRTLNEQIESSKTNLNRMSIKMGRMQEEWLDPLRELIGQIDKRFAAAFKAMGCAGEISICTGADERDFSQYGISIKVTYRNGEPLQELNSNIQSGGERAVATAAYMLALQELTPVPFRCVDEINQGMDENNERRIFELIVECTCQETSSQYFLITPKLVPNLKYSENMLVHIIHNGPFIERNRKWCFSRLCNPENIQIA